MSSMATEDARILPAHHSHSKRTATMLRLNSGQREVIADKVPDMANIIAAAIVIGFLVGQPGVSRLIVSAGIGFWIVAVLFVLMIVEPK